MTTCPTRGRSVPLDLFSLSVGLKLCVTDNLADGNVSLAPSDLGRPDDAILVHKVTL